MQEYDSSAYRCSCSSGYSGASCSIATAPSAAASTPANSSATPSGTYTCPIACEHGQCVDKLGSYSCVCSTGYWGASCSQASTTADAPAPNGTCTWCKHGTCKLLANSQNEYYCDCQTGYSSWDCGSATGRCAVLPVLDNSSKPTIKLGQISVAITPSTCIF